MSLEVNIKKKLHNFTLDVSFNCENETLALLGASGCGKSMTLKCIAGIETPDEGKIVLDGKILFDSSKKINLPPQKRGIGYLFQQFALFPNMTVAQNIYIGIKSKDKSEKKNILNYYLNSMQLTGLNNKYPYELSGGQKQRVALSRILASSPEVILLDEPFSSLDSYLKWQLENQLSDIISNFSGKVIWVSHDRDEVYRNCNKICVIDEGKSSNTKDSKELFRNPSTISAARLTGCQNFVKFVTNDSFTNSDNELFSVFIPEWNLNLQTTACPDESKTHIGFRAHFIHISPQSGDNIINCTIERIIENTFSMIYTIRPINAETNSSSIRVEINKEIPDEKKAGDSIAIGISPTDIMLLK